AGNAESGNEGDRANRHRHRRDGEADHRAPVPLQVARRGIECRVEEDRSDEQGKRELRVERDARHVGEEGERRAGEREKRWIGDADAARPCGEDRTNEEERDVQLEKNHGGSPPGREYASASERHGTRLATHPRSLPSRCSSCQILTRAVGWRWPGPHTAGRQTRGERRCARAFLSQRSRSPLRSPPERLSPWFGI